MNVNRDEKGFRLRGRKLETGIIGVCHRTVNKVGRRAGVGAMLLGSRRDRRDGEMKDVYAWRTARRSKLSHIL